MLAIYVMVDMTYDTHPTQELEPLRGCNVLVRLTQMYGVLRTISDRASFVQTLNPHCFRHFGQVSTWA